MPTYIVEAVYTRSVNQSINLL